jgi:hypothetical protein
MKTPADTRPRFTLRQNLLPSIALLLFGSCSALVFGSYDMEEVSKSRGQDQVYYEDSAKVFFVDYVNPFADKSLMWFASYLGGPVELRVHNTTTDSLERVFQFGAQPMPVYTLAMREDSTRLVKCVLFVNGRAKCARVYLAWEPLPIPQWKTNYTVIEY